MQEHLTSDELCDLIRNVFSPKSFDRRLAVLLDVPDETVPDNDLWRTRRIMAQEWVRELEQSRDKLNLETLLVWSNFPGVDHAACKRSIQLFTEEVMPRFGGGLTAHGEAAE